MRRLLRRSEGQVPEATVDRPTQDLKTLPCLDFSLRTTLASGQVFRWKEAGQGSFSGWIGPHFTQVAQREEGLTFQGISPEVLQRFFSLDVDLNSLARQIDVDPMIHEALKSHWGLRLIRQEPWECLSAFILSSFNNIPRLTGMLERLALCFGNGIEAASRGWRFAGPRPLTYRFPTAQVLAKVSERVLRNCGLGFRAPYLKAAAQRVASGEAPLEEWRKLEDEVLRQKLLTIPGVGQKVVECVMLFGFCRAAAFPVDVWIGRAMRAWYFPKRRVTDAQIREFARRHFGSHCGWAQQYLYCWARRASSRFKDPDL